MISQRKKLVDSETTGADPGFLLGGGALVCCSTSTPINHIFGQNTSCIRKPQVISGGGVRTPCTLPLDPPLDQDTVLSTCCNVKPFTLNEIFPANVAILCREPITIKSVFRIFNVSLFELSQLKIRLRSLLISVWRIDKSTAENV